MTLDVNANRLQIKAMQLDSLPLRQKMRIISIDWTQISETEGKRLRALGVEIGATVEALHRGILFWRDPLAVRIGRMNIAMRSKTAASIECEADENDG